MYRVVAKAYEGIGLHSQARDTWSSLRDRLLAKNTTEAFKYSHYYEFKEKQLEFVSLKKSGNAIDPLFLCSIAPELRGGERKRILRSVGGWFRVEWTALGMRVYGMLPPIRVEFVEIKLGARLFRRVRVKRFKRIFAYFHYHVRREVVAMMPVQSQLSIVSDRGWPVSFQGVDAARVTIPHGTGELLQSLETDRIVDKKGFLVPTQAELVEKQQRYLAIYDQARAVFEHEIGTPLFLLYGTLLGYQRENDFIEGDDDFDVGYVCYENDANSVREKTKRLVVRLVLNGFNISFNRSGRLFRLRRKEDPPGVHLDVRPVWFEGGHMWAHKHAHLPLRVEDFVPVKEGELRGMRVKVPGKAEKFLEAYYGSDWRVPDPDYVNVGKGIPKFVKRNLNMVCIRPSEYFEMVDQIEAQRSMYPNAGKLVATGLHPLYPLEEYNANCEW